MLRAGGRYLKRLWTETHELDTKVGTYGERNNVAEMQVTISFTKRSLEV